MQLLNLGILAHVDAGKTSLTERLLYAAGVIDEVGSVDDGNTQTDSLALERQRGITIKSAVVSFAIDDVTVNLIDTPGHSDFIAEVERVLSVLDGAVLVISAVEGVQAQTRALMRALQRLHIPTVIFVNKIDRSGARYEGTLQDIGAKLTSAIVSMGSVRDIGRREADFKPYEETDKNFAAQLIEQLTEHDDMLLAAYVDDGVTITEISLRDKLADQTGRGLVHPVFFGSAITGLGTEALMAGIKELLPTPTTDSDETLSGTVFKVERGPSGEKIAYVRLFSGTLRTRDQLQFTEKREDKVTALSVFGNGSSSRCASISAGQIGKVWGLSDVQIGDTIGTAKVRPSGRHHFAPPTLETVVIPTRLGASGELHAALTQLAEQDPHVNVRHDEVRQETFVSLYGEVQKEVIQTTLADEYGLNVTFRETTTICIERPLGTGEAVEIIDKEPNPFLATVGLRVEPAPIGSGVEFRLEVSLGSMPRSLFNAVEETVERTLHQGLYGWQVTDCTVVMTHSGYWPRQSHSHATFDPTMSSTAGDFRNLTPLVLMSALQRAGTTVYEPMQHFQLEVPLDLVGSLLPALTRLDAVPQTPAIRGSVCTIDGDIPAARVYELQQQLPSLTRGEGVLEVAFDRYQPGRGAIPSRRRTDANPLDRKEYLLRVANRV